MNKVLPGLYLGNYRDSKDLVQLDRHKITHIVAIHDAARRIHPDKEYLCIMASDSPYQNLTQYFSTCNDFIHTARVQSGCNVLIHCLAGMSRSVTIVVAYIMSITSFQLDEAQKVVRGARPVSNPNSGFQKQLQEFESSTRLFEERRRMLEKFPGTTFLESDTEYCKRLLVSYNNLLLTRAICEGRCHSARVCPSGTCRLPYASPRLTRLRSVDSSGQEPGSPGGSKVSPSGSPSYSGYAGSRNSSPRPHSAHNSPAKSPTIWERHYGCLKDHFRSRQLAAGSPGSPSNSTPASPIHYRVSKNNRSDSVASISSIASVVSLPAHLPATPRQAPVYTSTPPPTRKVLPSAASASPSNRSCPPTPRRTPNRRQLPAPAAGAVAGGGTPPYRGRGTPGTNRSQAVRPNDVEDEDETMTVVLHSDPSTSKAATATASIWTTPSTTRIPGQPVSARPSTGITRWVMKRSAYRFNSDQQQ